MALHVGVAEPRRRPLPWNDTSKPAPKPGPWDAPAKDAPASGDRGPSAEGAPRGRRRPGAPDPKPDRNGPATPWGRQEAAEKPRPVRRSPPPGRKPSDPQATSAPAPRGPHLDDLARQARTRLAHLVLTPSRRSVRAGVAAGLFGALAAAWGLSGVYEIGPDETGMVTRFGAFMEETGPGLHYHLPAPIETVRRLPAGGGNRLDVDAEAGGPGPMLTADGQLAEVSFSVAWRITDPYGYLFHAADPQAVLRREAEAAMRRAAAGAAFSDLTASDRGGVAAKATALLQAALRADDLGLAASSLQVRDVQPPAAAQGGFHDMAAAREDARIAAREVGAYRDRGLAVARGDAAKAVQAAQAARDQEVSEARGEAERFALVEAQYRKAPAVTRERLYTETMERVLHNTPKVIVQTPKGFGGQIVLPPELFRSKPAGTPAQGPSTQGPSTQGGSAPGQAGPVAAPAAGDAPSGPTA